MSYTLSGGVVGVNTSLTDLPISVEVIAQVIVIDQVDDARLNSALLQLNTTAINPAFQNKQMKLMACLNCPDVTIANVCELMNAANKKGFSSMFLSYCANMAKMHFTSKVSASTPLKAPVADPATTNQLSMLLANMQTQTNLMQQQHLLLATNKTNYAITPRTTPPNYDYKAADISMIKHVESRYQKWFYEEKLHQDDYTRYLHKIFESKKDQNEAYKTIQGIFL